jgi:hypothetical protein
MISWTIALRRLKALMLLHVSPERSGAAIDPALLVPRPDGPALPMTLAPGDEWNAASIQDDLEKLACENGWKGGLCVAIDHSMPPRPHLAKIAPGLRL